MDRRIRAWMRHLRDPERECDLYPSPQEENMEVLLARYAVRHKQHFGAWAAP